jgi:hypothetical protein
MRKIAPAVGALPIHSLFARVEQHHTFGKTVLFSGQSVGYIQTDFRFVLSCTYSAFFDRSRGCWFVWCEDAFGGRRLCCDALTGLPVVFLTDEEVFQFCCASHVQSEGWCAGHSSSKEVSYASI